MAQTDNMKFNLNIREDEDGHLWGWSNTGMGCQESLCILHWWRQVFKIQCIWPCATSISLACLHSGWDQMISDSYFYTDNSLFLPGLAWPETQMLVTMTVMQGSTNEATPVLLAADELCSTSWVPFLLFHTFHLYSKSYTGMCTLQGKLRLRVAW